jgi:hypothetical protein
MSKLIKAAEKLAEASDERVDWPTFHVYAKLALLWFPHDEDFRFRRSLDNLLRKAQSLVGYRYSRTEADMMTSALLLQVFGRSLEKPGHPKCVRVTVNPSLIYDLQKVMEKVPTSFPGVLDFRSSVICSIKSLVFTTHIRHARSKRKDVFWSKWRLSDLSYVSSMGYKDHFLVDRQKRGYRTRSERPITTNWEPARSSTAGATTRPRWRRARRRGMFSSSDYSGRRRRASWRWPGALAGSAWNGSVESKETIPVHCVFCDFNRFLECDSLFSPQ